MLNLAKISLVSALSLVGAANAEQSNDYPVPDIVEAPADAAPLTEAENSLPDTTAAPDLTNCPEQFFELPLYPNARFCQLFSEELPASMSYFANSDQQAAKDFYQAQLGQAENEDTLKGRIVLQYQNGQHVVIISKDGEGSQVDILVKPPVQG